MVYISHCVVESSAAMDNQTLRKGSELRLGEERGRNPGLVGTEEGAAEAVGRHLPTCHRTEPAGTGEEAQARVGLQL